MRVEDLAIERDGLKRAPALSLNQNPIFEKASTA
jgi:hypothetical protein